MPRQETEQSYDISEVIMGMRYKYQDKKRLVEGIRYALDEAYAQGRLDGTKETCTEFKTRMNHTYPKPDTYPER
jgi:hypothetical protein